MKIQNALCLLIKGNEVHSCFVDMNFLDARVANVLSNNTYVRLFDIKQYEFSYLYSEAEF